MILSKTDMVKALQVAERVRQSVVEFQWTLQPVTISIGCATLQHDVATCQDLITQADQALYQSKRDGRDRITLFQQAA